MRALWTIATLVMVLLVGYVAWRHATQRELPVEAYLPEYERLAELALREGGSPLKWYLNTDIIPAEARELMHRLGVQYFSRRDPMKLCGRHAECLCHYRFLRSETEVRGREIGPSRLGGFWTAIDQGDVGGCRGMEAFDRE